LTTSDINVHDRVELIKSVRASGVILDAGLHGSVIAFDPVEHCEIRFDGIGGTSLVKSKFLRKFVASSL
jgi:hypothetical protein